jgi:OmpA family
VGLSRRNRSCTCIMKRLILLSLACACGLTHLHAERDTLRVYFDAGRNEVSGFQQTLIDIFVQTHYTTGEVIVAGHTDDLGKPSTNLDHSRERARGIASYLLDRGLRPDQLVVEAWGESNPLYPNTSDQNRARNRRVELIGIPDPKPGEDVRPLAVSKIVLQNGAAIPYRELATPEGRPKRILVIHLDREEVYDPFGFGVVPAIQGQQITAPCPGDSSFVLQIPTTSNQRCPLRQIIFNEPRYRNEATSTAMQYGVLEPVQIDSSYFFMVQLPDLRNCYAPNYALGKGCFTIHEARIRLERVRSRDFHCGIQGVSLPVKPMGQRDGSYKVQYINDDPSTLKINAIVYKSKHNRVHLKDLPLNRLPYNPQTNEYMIRVKDLKMLRKKIKAPEPKNTPSK